MAKVDFIPQSGPGGGAVPFQTMPKIGTHLQTLNAPGNIQLPAPPAGYVRCFNFRQWSPFMQLNKVGYKSDGGGTARFSLNGNLFSAPAGQPVPPVANGTGLPFGIGGVINGDVSLIEILAIAGTYLTMYLPYADFALPGLGRQLGLISDVAADLFAAPAAGKSRIPFIDQSGSDYTCYLFNRDTIAHDFVFELNDGTNVYEYATVNVLAGANNTSVQLAPVGPGAKYTVRTLLPFVTTQPVNDGLYFEVDAP